MNAAEERLRKERERVGKVIFKLGINLLLRTQLSVGVDLAFKWWVEKIFIKFDGAWNQLSCKHVSAHTNQIDSLIDNAHALAIRWSIRVARLFEMRVPRGTIVFRILSMPAVVRIIVFFESFWLSLLRIYRWRFRVTCAEWCFDAILRIPCRCLMNARWRIERSRG